MYINLGVSDNGVYRYTPKKIAQIAMSRGKSMMIWLLKLRSPYFCGSEKVSFPTCWLMIIGVFFCSRYWELSYSIWGPPYQPTIISGIFSILNSFAYDRGLC